MKEIVVKFVAAALGTAMLALMAVGCGGVDATEVTPPASQPEQTVSTTVHPTQGQPQTQQPIDDPVELDMSNALFIGDSRTVGLMEYSGLESDFFASVGMSVYNVEDEEVSVPNVGKVTLDQLLSNREYDTIYLMLGINELGYDMDQTVNVYGKLVEDISKSQPNAKIMIQANLHVTQEKSRNHDYITNERIDEFNDKTAGLADGKNIFYLDANHKYDDEDGAMSPEVTSDGAHLYAKYYEQWGTWIKEESQRMLEGSGR